jgi:hypothetical protein
MNNYDRDCEAMMAAGRNYLRMETRRSVSDPACQQALATASPGHSGAQHQMVEHRLHLEFPDRR